MRHSRFTFSSMILGLLFIGQSCKVIRMTDFDSSVRNENPIPLLEPFFDYASIERAYVFGTRNYRRGPWGDQFFINDPIIGVRRFVDRDILLPDMRLQDAVVMFEKELNENICTEAGPTKGKAIFRINNAQVRTSGWGFLLLSSLTLTIPNWFGMPLFNYNTEIALEVEIRDCNDKTIGRYTGIGTKKIPVAAWHGYCGENIHYIQGNEDAARKSNLEAIKIAMTEIKQKINRNAIQLSRELERCR